MSKPALLLSFLAVVAWMTCGCSTNAARSSTASSSSRGTTQDDRVFLPPGSPKLKQISTAAVQLQDVPREEITAPGKVELDPNRVSRVLMPVPGRVRSVLVKLGDAVSEGQQLLVVESPEASSAVAAFSQAEARLRQAISEQAKAEKDSDRVKALYEHRAAALKDVQNAENDLVRAQSAVVQSQAEVEEAQQRLGMLGLKPDGRSRDVFVRAPIDGKVLEIAVAPGEYRNDTSASLMTIADLKTVWITSNVPESRIRLIQVGERVDIELAAYPGEVFRGQVKRIADTVDPETRTIKVQAELANPGGRFRPEMFGNMHHSHGSHALPMVAASAVIQGGHGPMVYVQKGAGEFQRIPVQAGDVRGGLVPILSGLGGGELVVVDGALLLRGN